MASELKFGLVGLAIGTVGMGSFFVIAHIYNFNPDKHSSALFLCLALALVLAFLWWNRGKNLALVRALCGTDPMIVQHADGHLSGKCLRCGYKIHTDPIPGPPYEYKCPSCLVVIQIQGPRSDA
jgi:hypothetical protein